MCYFHYSWIIFCFFNEKIDMLMDNITSIRWDESVLYKISLSHHVVLPHLIVHPSIIFYALFCCFLFCVYFLLGTLKFRFPPFNHQQHPQCYPKRFLGFNSTLSLGHIYFLIMYDHHAPLPACIYSCHMLIPSSSIVLQGLKMVHPTH